VLDDGFIRVIETEAGEMRVLPSRPPSAGHGDGGDGDDEGESSSFLARDGLALGLLSLEPKALLLPHYTDADCLFVVYRGKNCVLKYVAFVICGICGKMPECGVECVAFVAKCQNFRANSHGIVLCGISGMLLYRIFVSICLFCVSLWMYDVTCSACS
jgi:hypothetical protein